MRQRVPRGPELRDSQLPRCEGVPHAPHLFAEPSFGETRRDLLAVGEWNDLDLEIPTLSWIERQPKPHSRIVDLAALRQDHLSLQRQVTVVGDQELVALLVVLERARVGKRFGAQRITEREVVVLDRKDV